MKGITLVYEESSAEVVKRDVEPLFGQHLKISIALKASLNIDLRDDDFIVTYLSDELLKELLPLAIEKNWRVGFLPHPEMIFARRGFGVAASLEEAVQNILNTDTAQEIDLLMVNKRPVFDMVVIGECLSVLYGSAEPSDTKRFMGKTKSFFKLFKRLNLKQYTIEFKEKEDGDKESIDTAALGMVVVQHGKSSILSRKILENSFVNDGMMHNLILAPESVSGLLEFGLLSFFKSGKNQKLPPFAAHIKTNRLKVQSNIPMELSVDNNLMSAKEIELEVAKKVISIVPGIHLDTEGQANNKEIFKTQKLPRGKKKEELLKGPLPFLKHATTEEFKDLFTTLRENARPASSYLVLMFLSTFIATLGLFSNSSPVIIGAMILAPLMSPIISLSMGVLRQDNQLIKESLKSIGLGLLVGYLCSLFLTWLTPLSLSNFQIQSRTSPNLLDLGIAVGSGVAGAYAHAKKEVAQTLAGVAIAVALIPPLAVSGIGLGWMSWHVFSGALLLLITNLAGMILAAAITFLFLGFSPFRLAKKGLIVSLVFVLCISGPLAFGFFRMVRESNLIENLSGERINNLLIRDVEVRQASPLRISLKVVTERPLDETELKALKEKVEELVGEEVELEITVGIAL
jgi:uncharacterized hydrophobic protein (TIGR00271 family)